MRKHEDYTGKGKEGKQKCNTAKKVDYSDIYVHWTGSQA